MQSSAGARQCDRRGLGGLALAIKSLHATHAGVLELLATTSHGIHRPRPRLDVLADRLSGFARSSSSGSDQDPAPQWLRIKSAERRR